MIKIFDAKQIKYIDNYTIEEQGMSSVDLMERASLAVFWLLIDVLDSLQDIYVFVGNGNNGGDALAIARMLLTKHYSLKVYMINSGGKLTPDCQKNGGNLARLMAVHMIKESRDIPEIPKDCVIIDGLFGSGLNRPLEGVYSDVVKTINASGCKVYSIDIPSGMSVTDNTELISGQIVKSDMVYSFQYPKLALLLPESSPFYKDMEIVDIGLSRSCIENEATPYHYIEKQDIVNMLLPKNRFSHKGDNGRAFLVAGSFGKIGAAVLAAHACLRGGVGLLTVHVPRCGVEIIQASVPEAMVSVDKHSTSISEVPDDLGGYTIGVGPGIGTSVEAKGFLHKLLKSNRDNPMVLDADALNLISSDRGLLKLIPPYSILTPHPVEFDRLTNKHPVNGYQRLQNARNFAGNNNVFVVLKGAYTAIVTPERDVYFNSTGNPGMATGGSGDVLTGIITSLLAQKYKPLHAALLGVYIHGLAADLAAVDMSQRSILPSDIIGHLGRAYKELEKV